MPSASLNCQFTVIGAGPYGLAVACHLRALGRDIRIFGKPMGFWSTQMPKGMFLRSPWAGSNIGHPNGLLTLDRYEASLGTKLDRRIPLQDFVRYGQWFQQRTLPNLDPRDVAWVEPSAESSGGGYLITLDDGECFYSQNVVVATGIGAFSACPQPYTSLPPDLASHTSDRLNQNLCRFAGKCVAVVGAGQSALESAALLHEAGAEVELLVRGPQVRWLTTRPLLDRLMDSKLNPFQAPGKIGPLGVNWLVEHPALFTLMSRELQEAFTRRAIRPAGSHWLRARTGSITITTNRHAVNALVRDDKVHLELNDGSKRTVDHVLMGTGYKIDIARYDFLSRELLESVRTVRGYPVLNSGFESSLAGLYFVGTTAAYSFGPLLRFVAGTQYAAGALSSHAIQVRVRRTVQVMRVTKVQDSGEFTFNSK